MTALHMSEPGGCARVAPKPAPPRSRSPKLIEVCQSRLDVVVEAAATVQFGRGRWVLDLAPDRPAVDVVKGDAGPAADLDQCYRRMVMEMLVAVLERLQGTGSGAVVRVVSSRRLLAELQRQIAGLDLGETVRVAEVRSSSEGLLEYELAQALSATPGVVDVVSDASKGRGPLLGLGWVVATAGGSSVRTGATTQPRGSILQGELAALRRGVHLAVTLHPALRDGVGKLRLFSDSRAGLELLRNARAGRFPASLPGSIHEELQRICMLLAKSTAELHWVKGHSGDPLNEIADRLAVVSRRSSEAGLDAAQKFALRSRIQEDAALALREHSRCHFHLAA